MSQLDKIVFGSKTFSNVLEEIYNNQKKKENQVVSNKVVDCNINF